MGIFNVNIPRQIGWNVTYNGANDTTGTANPVYSGSYNFTVSFNVSWFVPQQTQQPQTAPLPTDLRKVVDDRLKTGDCEMKLKEVLSELAKAKSVQSTDIGDILDTVLNEGGVNLAELNGTPKQKAKLLKNIQNGKSVSLRYGNSYFKFNGDRAIDLQAFPVFPSTVNTINIANTQANYVTTLIHELFHHARGEDGKTFSHRQIAQAIANVDSSFSAKGNDSKNSK